jgi:molecular chaperone DnaJ
MELPIKLSQAILGDTVDVEMLDGEIKLKVPEGTQSGDVLKVRGKGIPSAQAGSPFSGGSHRGDLLIEIHVRYPQKLSPRAKKLVEELRNEGW